MSYAIRPWWSHIGIVSLLAISVVVVGQMRHDGVIVLNCSDYPIYANMTYTVLGEVYSVHSHVLTKFNKLAVVKYPPVIDNCSVNMIFYMQPKGRGNFIERGRVTVPADSGGCFYVNQPDIENPYRLCETERILMGIRTCPDRWVLDDNFNRKTQPPADETTTKATRAAPKTSKDTAGGFPKVTKAAVKGKKG